MISCLISVSAFDLKFCEQWDSGGGILLPSRRGHLAVCGDMFGYGKCWG